MPGEPVPLASAMVGPAPTGTGAGTRAGAVVGTVLGTLAFLSSLMYILSKVGPGVSSLFSPGVASAAGGTSMAISPPRATSNLAAVQAAGGAGGGGGAGSTKLTVVNGSAAGKTDVPCFPYIIRYIKPLDVIIFQERRCVYITSHRIAIKFTNKNGLIKLKVGAIMDTCLRTLCKS